MNLYSLSKKFCKCNFLQIVSVHFPTSRFFTRIFTVNSCWAVQSLPGLYLERGNRNVRGQTGGKNSRSVHLNLHAARVSSPLELMVNPKSIALSKHIVNWVLYHS